MFKLMDKKIIAILRKLICLTGPMPELSFFISKMKGNVSTASQNKEQTSPTQTSESQ